MALISLHATIHPSRNSFIPPHAGARTCRGVAALDLK
jgi:hypothetical protein